MKKAIHIFFLFMLILSILHCKTQKQKGVEITAAISEGNIQKLEHLSVNITKTTSKRY